MVAIKDFEMPSCCGECSLTCCKGYDEPWNYCCSVTLTDINLNDTEKLDNCPLVEIEEPKLEKIKRIVNDYDGSTPSMVCQFTKLQRILEQE